MAGSWKAVATMSSIDPAKLLERLPGFLRPLAGLYTNVFQRFGSAELFDMAVMIGRRKNWKLAKLALYREMTTAELTLQAETINEALADLNEGEPDFQDALGDAIVQALMAALVLL